MDIKKQFLKDWKYIRSNTYKFIKSVPSNKFNFSPHKDWGTIGRQLRHMADVQECYINALENGKVTFNNKRKDYSLEKDKKKLVEYMKNLDKQLEKKLQKMSSNDLLKKVKWEEVGNPPLIVMLDYMEEHEIFHQGILQLYASLAEFKTLRFF